MLHIVREPLLHIVREPLYKGEEFSRQRRRLQVDSYCREVTFDVGETDVEFIQRPLFSVKDGRCVSCGCSVWRHSGRFVVTLKSIIFLFIECQACPYWKLKWAEKGKRGKGVTPIELPLDSFSCIGGLFNSTYTRSKDSNDVRIENVILQGVDYYPLYKKHQHPLDKNTNFDKGTVYDMQDGRCEGCVKEIPFHEVTKDHMIPKSKGYKLTMKNARLMCTKCNNKKKNLNMYEFLTRQEVEAIPKFRRTMGWATLLDTEYSASATEPNSSIPAC